MSADGDQVIMPLDESERILSLQVGCMQCALSRKVHVFGKMSADGDQVIMSLDKSEHFTMCMDTALFEGLLSISWASVICLIKKFL
jgi:hypothetical protein